MNGKNIYIKRNVKRKKEIVPRSTQAKIARRKKKKKPECGKNKIHGHENRNANDEDN